MGSACELPRWRPASRCLFSLLLAASAASISVAQQPPGTSDGLVYTVPANVGNFGNGLDWPAPALPAHQWLAENPGVQQVSAVGPAPSPNEVIPAPNPSSPPPPTAVPPESKEKIGQAPEDFSHQFLRQESVLLKCGEMQIDVGLNYTVFDHQYTNLVIDETSGDPTIIALDSRVTRRLMLVPLDVRYGICDTLQGFIEVPFGWSNTQDSYPGHDEFVNTTGIGDVTPGVSWLIHKGNGCSHSPDVIATFAFTAPTADVSPLQGILEPPNALLGQGFWFGAWNVLFVHTIDPVVLFYGVGSRHGVSRHFDGFNVHPGDQYSYRFGLGFAVNERLTLSGMLMGSYITEPKLDGRDVEGLAMEPISMRLAATIARCGHLRFLEPFAEIGMTDDAPNARIGVTCTY